MRSTASSVPVRILSHNIRYATSSPFQGERPWPERRPLLLNQFQFHARHNQESFLCLQEVLHVQLVDLLSGLNGTGAVTSGGTDSQNTDEEWAYIGVGRDDGKEAGEYAPIFYRPATWELKGFKTVWLSKTPTIPSKSWDAASIRIVTIGVFKHRESRKTVLALNTHLDNQGARSRAEAARIILEQIESYSSDVGNWFLAGDFNSKEDDEAYQILTGYNSSLQDVQKLIPSEYHYGDENTFTGFGYEDIPPKRIDYVLIGPPESTSTKHQTVWSLQGYSVQPSRFEDGVYNSDHRAVVVDTQLI